MFIHRQSLLSMKITSTNDKDSNESIINQSASALGNSIGRRINEIDYKSSDSQLVSSIDDTDKILMVNKDKITWHQIL